MDDLFLTIFHDERCAVTMRSASGACSVSTWSRYQRLMTSISAA